MKKKSPLKLKKTKSSLGFKKMDKKILVVCGPTGTGKTSLGLFLAGKFGGEIVSADSRQIYQGMDLATGKDLPRKAKYYPVQKKSKFKVGYYLFGKVPVWLLDLAPPNYPFSVADYHKVAHGVIEDIWERGKLPILVGGTGLYIKAVVEGIETLGVPPNQQLRAAYDRKSAGELFDILFHLDPAAAGKLNPSERQNKRRLVRKIEIAQAGVGAKVKQIKKQWPGLETYFIGLAAPSEVLYSKIDRRIDEWVFRGAKREVEGLLKKGYLWELPAMSGIGYRQWQPYFDGKANVKEVAQRWKFDEHSYARRQMTWFKKDRRINWFKVTDGKWRLKVEKKVKQWYNGGKSREKNKLFCHAEKN